LSKLDCLLSLANIHGPSPKDVPGSSVSVRDLESMDVYAACAFGNLPIQSYVLGLAVHMKDEKARRLILDFGLDLVRKTFAEHDWSARSPFEKRYNRLANTGAIGASEAEMHKAADAESLPHALTALALADMDGAQDCPTCQRAGRLVRTSECRHCLDGFVWLERVMERPLPAVMPAVMIDIPAFRQNRERCGRCNGHGERRQFFECDTCKGWGRVSSLTDAERARRCNIQPDAWRKTWRRRYVDYILREFDVWLVDYEDHIVRKT